MTSASHRCLVLLACSTVIASAEDPSPVATPPPPTSTQPAIESVPNTLTQAEKDAGWILLFDGATLTGWRGYKMDRPAAGWSALGSNGITFTDALDPATIDIGNLSMQA